MSLLEAKLEEFTAKVSKNSLSLRDRENPEQINVIYYKIHINTVHTIILWSGGIHLLLFLIKR